MLKKINKIIRPENKRDRAAINNIAISYLFKGLQMLMAFLLIPIILNYLDEERYGIWLTVSSIIGWFHLFNIGLGMGLRNKLAESFQKKDFNKAKQYLSTTYIALFFIILCVYIIIIVLNLFINWSTILNVSQHYAAEISNLFLIVFSFFCLQFVIGLVGVIFISDQKPGIKQIFDFIAYVISFFLIYYISKNGNGRLEAVGVVYSGVMPLVLLVISFIVYNGKYRLIRPSLSAFNKELLKDLVGLGGKFFIIKISTIILFTSDNLIISNLFGAKEVTPYGISRSFFNYVNIFFSILMTPYWSAFTQAFVNNERKWINNTIKKLIYMWILLLFGLVFLLLISKWFYGMWLGNKITVPFALNLLMAIFTAIMMFNQIYGNFLNGTSKIQTGLYIAVIQGIVNIPLSVFLAKYCNMGINGVILATIICIFPGLILSPLQYKMIITNKAKGIWNK